MKAPLALATVLALWICSAVTQPRMASSAEPAASSQAVEKSGSPEHMVYDAQSRRVVLLTASNKSGRQELWNWDGKQWTFIPGSGPEARELGGAAYDARRKRIVLYGGMGLKPSADRKADTWEWDGKNWHQMTDTHVGTRDHHAMAYDEARGKTVLFGGAKSSELLETATWEWDGDKWKQVATQGPGGRAHFAMVYDSKRKQVVLFGGMDQRNKVHNDTWAWDGMTWQKLSAEGPPPRYRHSMTFDSDAGVIILFGGLPAGRSDTSFEDTWIWDGQQWKEIKMAGPTKRNSHVMAYDPVRRRTVLYGGGFWDGKVGTIYDDTWEWDGKQWTQIK